VTSNIQRGQRLAQAPNELDGYIQRENRMSRYLKVLALLDTCLTSLLGFTMISSAQQTPITAIDIADSTVSTEDADSQGQP